VSSEFQQSAAGTPSATASIWSDEPVWGAADRQPSRSAPALPPETPPEAPAQPPAGPPPESAPPILTFEQLTRPPEPPPAPPAPLQVAPTPGDPVDPARLRVPDFSNIESFTVSEAFPAPSAAPPASGSTPAPAPAPAPAPGPQAASVPDWATLPPRADGQTAAAPYTPPPYTPAPSAPAPSAQPSPPGASGVGAVSAAQEPTLSVLHVGCGPRNPSALPAALRTQYWREVRLDANPAMEPDIVASITDMREVPSGSMDAVYSSHNLEHVYPHEAPLALREFARVLKADGLCLIQCPDLQTIGPMIAEGRLFEPIYQSPAGPIAPIDMLFGHRASMAAGNLYMAHKGGFTAPDLARLMQEAGFAKVAVTRDPARFSLWALGFRLELTDELVARCQANLGIGVPALPAPRGPASA